jgi:hypothetical protein
MAHNNSPNAKRHEEEMLRTNAKIDLLHAAGAGAHLMGGLATAR